MIKNTNGGSPEKNSHIYRSSFTARTLKLTTVTG